jgi:hypothetical protein
MSRGAPGIRPAGTDAGERERDEVGRAGGGGFAAALGQEPVQDMLAVLGLGDGILHPSGGTAGRLVPLAIAAADMPALHLDDRDTDTGPGRDKVGLVLGGALDHRHRMQQRRIAGKLVTQHPPDPPLRHPAGPELRLGADSNAAT